MILLTTQVTGKKTEVNLLTDIKYNSYKKKLGNFMVHEHTPSRLWYSDSPTSTDVLININDMGMKVNIYKNI